MKVPMLLCLAIYFSTTTADRQETYSGPRDGRIVGGYNARPRSHPYLVSLQIRFLWVRMRLCSGSLLNERWILTAGHCVKGSWLLNWLTMEAVVGTNDLEKKDPTAQTVRILERIPHPKYDGGIGSYDIALLKTAKNIVYTNAVSPIEVPLTMGSLSNKTQNLILAGWGVLETTFFLPASPDKLQEARVEYLPFEECNKAIDDIKESYEENPLDRIANICTGPITGGIAACSGDSGGPLIQFISYKDLQTTTATSQLTTEEYDTTSLSNNSNANEIDDTTESEETINSSSTSITTEKVPAVADIVQNYKEKGFIPVVIGVVSWGISPCGEVGAPTVYTNVTTYADFIYTHLYN